MTVLLFSLSHILWVIHVLNCPYDARGVEVCEQQHMFLCCALQWAPSTLESMTCFFTVAGRYQIGDIASRAWNDMKAGQCVPLACSSYSSCKKKGKYRARNIFHQLLVWPHSMVFIKKGIREGVKSSSLILKLSPLLPKKVVTTTTPCTSTFPLEFCLGAEGIQGAWLVERRYMKSAHFMEEWFEILLLF